jgi:hypothetical protein
MSVAIFSERLKMLSNPWVIGIALLVAVAMIGMGVKMIFNYVINKETGPGGLPPGSTD